MRILIGLALASAFLAASCQSDETVMANARKDLGEQCRGSVPPGVDPSRYCDCVVNRSIGTKTVPELRNMSEKEGQELGMQAATQCLTEAGFFEKMGASPAAPAAAPAAEPPAAEEAKEEAGEATEEAIDEAN